MHGKLLSVLGIGKVRSRSANYQHVYQFCGCDS